MSAKAAILDSDFTIKSALTKNSHGKSLGDVVLELPYKFFCHEQNKIEVTDHAEIASAWLEKNIAERKIQCVSDLQILAIIKDKFSVSNNNAIKFYADYLKQACDVFTKSFFEINYRELNLLTQNENIITDDEFCAAIEAGDLSVGKGRNLGEIKDTLLAIAINQCLQMDCINFCSDDNRARRSLLRFSQNDFFPIKSISYLGFYWIAKQKNLLSKEQELEFLLSWKKISRSDDLNITIKEHLNRKQADYPKRNIDDLFEAIWNDEVVMVNDGYLVYKSELI